MQEPGQKQFFLHISSYLFIFWAISFKFQKRETPPWVAPAYPSVGGRTCTRCRQQSSSAPPERPPTLVDIPMKVSGIDRSLALEQFPDLLTVHALARDAVQSSQEELFQRVMQSASTTGKHQYNGILVS